MQAGRYDQRIDLMVATVTRGATYLQPISDWAPFATDIPAGVEYRSAGATVAEPIIAGQQQSTLRAIWTFRYIDGVRSTMRIKHGTRYWHVLDVAVVGRNRGLRLTAVEWNEGRR